MNRRNKFSEDQKQEIITYVNAHGYADCRERFNVWPDTVRRWIYPEINIARNNQLSELYHTKYKHDQEYKDRIKERGQGNYKRHHLNSKFSCSQMREFIALSCHEAIVQFNITEKDWNRCLTYINRIDEYRELNKSRIQENTKQWIANNTEIVKQSQAEYVSRNKDKIRERVKIRKQNDPVFKLTENIRTRIYQGLKGISKSQTTDELLGCTFPAFREYLETKFTPDMTWDNYGSLWHVDHIKPISLFNLSDPEEQKLAFNYINCQPLHAILNLKKSNKYGI